MICDRVSFRVRGRLCVGVLWYVVACRMMLTGWLKDNFLPYIVLLEQIIIMLFNTAAISDLHSTSLVPQKLLCKLLWLCTHMFCKVTVDIHLRSDELDRHRVNNTHVSAGVPQIDKLRRRIRRRRGVSGWRRSIPP